MKVKTISARSSFLLERLTQQEKNFFTSSDALAILKGSKPSAVREQLRQMVGKGLLLRIKGGLYHIIPFEQDNTKYFPDWHQVAAALARPREYYIGFYSALHLHGLITQPSLVEQVVTKQRVLPKIRKIKKVKFEFITLQGKYFFGYKKQWIDNFNQVYCSDLEKTFVDCLYMPQYAGGITEIMKALHKCKSKIDEAKLKKYLEQFNTQVVYKRLGFLSEQMGIFENLWDFISQKITATYAPLDPQLPKKGIHHSKWRIIDNMDIHSAIQSIQT